MIYSKEVVLILIDTLAVTFPIALVFASVFTFTISLALGAEIIAKHGTEDKVLFGRELVQWTGNDKPDGLQAFAPPEIHV